MRGLKGFTLIEILVVIVIISIVTTVSLITLSVHANKQIESTAREFAGLVRAAEESAMLTPSVIGIRIKEDGYEFLEARQETQGKLSWVKMDDDVFKAYQLQPNLQIYLQKDELSERDQKEKTLSPQIIISTNGDITPFIVYIGKKGMKPHIIIKGEPDGFITQQTLS